MSWQQLHRHRHVRSFHIKSIFLFKLFLIFERSIGSSVSALFLEQLDSRVLFHYILHEEKEAGNGHF